MTRFAPTDSVTVRRAFPPGHVRTPYYIRGKTGTIAQVLDSFANPEELAFGRDGLPAVFCGCARAWGGGSGLVYRF